MERLDKKNMGMKRREKILEVVAGITADENVAINYAKHLEELFESLMPNRIGKEYEEAIAKEEYEKAIHLCASYYRNKPDCTVEELSGKGNYQKQEAEKAIAGFMREVNIEWEFHGGDIDFLFNPTKIQGPVNHEWLWQLNRHYYWRNMGRTYSATGEEKYAAAFEKQLLKWIAQTYIPEKWNGPGSAWRTIECGLRLLGSWQVAFQAFRKSESVSDVALLLMISSMHRQSLHLIAHPTGANWLMMEANGIYTFSSLFPEFSDAERNREIAARRILKEVKLQILPDGMQNELSPDYHSVVFHCAANFYSLAIALKATDEIPGELVTLLDKAANATLALSTPGFTQPRTNDCFTMYTKDIIERADKLIKKRLEYTFVSTERKEGMPPTGKTASRFLPYAGFAVMRSDWSADATYLCFDVGPLGKAHMHQDKLNINLYKGNEELIYDDGGGQYEVSSMRDYAISGYAHNTVLVDGMAQNREEPKQVLEPIDAGWISNEHFDYAVAVYDDTYGNERIKPAVHKREVRFCKPGFFCVSDHLSAVDEERHTYEVLFHLDTTKMSALKEYKNAVISEFGRDYEVALIPLDEEVSIPELKMVSGQVEPSIRGWYNGRNDRDLHEAITVSREVKNVKNYRFTTLLVPLKNGQALPRIKRCEDQKWEIVFDAVTYDLDMKKLDS